MNVSHNTPQGQISQFCSMRNTTSVTVLQNSALRFLETPLYCFPIVGTFYQNLLAYQTPFA